MAVKWEEVKENQVFDDPFLGFFENHQLYLLMTEDYIRGVCKREGFDDQFATGCIKAMREVGLIKDINVREKGDEQCVVSTVR